MTKVDTGGSSARPDKASGSQPISGVEWQLLEEAKKDREVRIKKIKLAVLMLCDALEIDVTKLRDGT